MNSPATWLIHVDGIGCWAPGLVDWAAVRACLRGEIDPDPDAAKRPAPAMLAAAERRRAPDSVLLALEVAVQACAAAGRAPDGLPGIFTCTYGDLAITDFMCSTLASAPSQLSPTKFHNSVHNAAAGYWGIASGNQAATTALCAGPDSFAAGLLEAVLQLQADAEAILLVGYDIASPPVLAQVAPSAGLFGAALVLTRSAGPRTLVTLQISLLPQAPVSAGAFSSAVLQQLYTSNPMARCLPLLQALAGAASGPVQLAAGTALTLQMEMIECPH